MNWEDANCLLQEQREELRLREQALNSAGDLSTRSRFRLSALSQLPAMLLFLLLVVLLLLLLVVLLGLVVLLALASDRDRFLCLRLLWPGQR